MNDGIVASFWLPINIVLFIISGYWFLKTFKKYKKDLWPINTTQEGFRALQAISAPLLGLLCSIIFIIEDILVHF